ncbi:MAG TPA: hypothetical protein VLG44_01510 [Chlamydiales bacterium]|nr:hypothetical protein [Chlamydiales bacterium]
MSKKGISPGTLGGINEKDTFKSTLSNQFSVIHNNDNSQSRSSQYWEWHYRDSPPTD